ncbi:hypothetical protein [Fusobacterium polymorphum]|mgnify:FL=1|jgi:hypothetical protein|uniref:hypothetical protein n=1 Tax=Fusobacterium nucleatum subsp. polymorphum TaxID=76857 RepID=UPI00300A724A
MKISQWKRDFVKVMKKNKIITYENVLNINNLVREFHTKILQLIEFENFIIIRIEYNSQISDNIFCINYENKIIWNISEIIKRNDEAYTGLNKISDNIIEVFLFIGICYRIDVVERKILEKRIVK